MNVHAAKLASELRSVGIRTELGDETFRLKKSFEIAKKLGINQVVILGENEAASGEITVKNLKSGAQVKMARSQLSENIGSSAS